MNSIRIILDITLIIVSSILLGMKIQTYLNNKEK